ncbi:type II secretion system F family protein [Pseudomonas sp. GD04058]|uniref:type II secretion system F family protein n=1 Tax=Pseudomonas sp. GD04058 TaxID=2975429 RepID=UPI002448C345|nr:type II secretion system F family protein [Pseudomonas sp. GD04058]MDG9884927.1 type II secretion system F family protein [Pseudomonas sp. GD04058]
MKTRTYRRQGVDRNGARVSGRSDGQSPALVKAMLRKRGIHTTRIRHSRRLAALRWSRQLDAAQLTQLSRHLATLFQAGIPLLHGLDIIADGSRHPRMIKLLAELKRDISAGNSLAESLRKHPRYFDALYCNLVAVGEASGRLDVLLDQLATYQEKRAALRSRMRKAMLYPLLVLMVGLGVASLLLLQVVPQFEVLFAGMGSELPPFTRMVIGLADWLSAHILALSLALALAAVGVRQLFRYHQAFHLRVLGLAHRLPLVGRLLQHAAMARFARTLHTCLVAGIPLTDALVPVAKASGNALYERAIRRLRQDLGNGLALSTAMRASPLFPHLCVQMCSIGETSGTLDDMLDRIANHHEQSIDQLMENLTSLLEPVIVLVLGLLIGSLVIAMYLPIFQLGSVI